MVRSTATLMQARPMETTSIASSSSFSCSGLMSHRARGPRLPRKSRTIQFAHKRDTYGWDYGGGLVDENMVALRKRIQEMKMAERNYEPPSHWMDWEKRYYTSYESDVCEMVGILQTLLMNSRPSIAIGTMALVIWSVPTSMIWILMHLMQASSSMLSAMQLN